MGCSIFKSLPLPPTHPTPKRTRGDRQPAFVSRATHSSRTAPAGRPLTELLLSSSPEEGGLPPRPGPGVPGRLLGLCIRACTSALGSRPGACSILTASASLPRRFWSRQADPTCSTECGEKGGSGPGRPPDSSGTRAGRRRRRDWTCGGIAPKCCQTDRIFGSAILAWILAQFNYTASRNFIFFFPKSTGWEELSLQPAAAVGSARVTGFRERAGGHERAGRREGGEILQVQPMVGLTPRRIGLAARADLRQPRLRLAQLSGKPAYLNHNGY